jgi:hypothetical protein
MNSIEPTTKIIETTVSASVAFLRMPRSPKSLDGYVLVSYKIK